jgi:2-succinyl-5-enolpyruvyl-6-hydroxy-3-cyclohexene-1-carboxylate synthase
LFEAFVCLIDRNGPSHINLYFEEPLYQRATNQTTHREVIEIEPAEFEAFEIEDFEIKSPSPKIMIYISTIQKNEPLIRVLKKWNERSDTVICAELTSNIHEIDAIVNADYCTKEFVNHTELYQPDILVTIGGTMISKRFRTSLQQHLPIWHVDIHHTERSWNAFDTNFNFLHAHPHAGLEFLYNYLPPKVHSYKTEWKLLSDKRLQIHRSFLLKPRLSEFFVVDQLMQHASENQIFMWGNSTTIRYAHWCYIQNRAIHYANRGVSGIDGVLSTAIGIQIANPEKEVICVLGDVSMIYESSTLINLSKLSHFKIVILNNHGGKIFEHISSFSNPREASYFTTPSDFSFHQMASLYQLNYHHIASNDFDFSSILHLIQRKNSKDCIEINFPEASNKEWSEYFEKS